MGSRRAICPLGHARCPHRRWLGRAPRAIMDPSRGGCWSAMNSHAHREGRRGGRRADEDVVRASALERVDRAPAAPPGHRRQRRGDRHAPGPGRGARGGAAPLGHRGRAGRGVRAGADRGDARRGHGRLRAGARRRRRGIREEPPAQEGPDPFVGVESEVYGALEPGAVKDTLSMFETPDSEMGDFPMPDNGTVAQAMRVQRDDTPGEPPPPARASPATSSRRSSPTSSPRSSGSRTTCSTRSRRSRRARRWSPSS